MSSRQALGFMVVKLVFSREALSFMVMKLTFSRQALSFMVVRLKSCLVVKPRVLW